MNYGVNRYKRPEKRFPLRKETARQEEREAYLQSQEWTNFGERFIQNKSKEEETKTVSLVSLKETFSTLLKNAPLLEPWQREVCSYCSQGKPILLSSETNTSDEWGLGNLLALHHS